MATTLTRSEERAFRNFDRQLPEDDEELDAEQEAYDEREEQAYQRMRDREQT